MVARNLAFNREHDGPVVVTEPYFMNEHVTLQRLLAGDYKALDWKQGGNAKAFSGSMQTALRQDLWMRMRETPQTDQKKE